MDAGPEFEYTEAELRMLAKFLINKDQGSIKVMTKYKRKYFLKMQQLIENFKEKPEFFSYFVDEMNCLYFELENNDENFGQSFSEDLAILDSIGADEPDIVSNELHKKLFFQAVLDLEKIVSDKLLELIEVKLTVNALMQKVNDLLEEALSREDAANWAYAITEQEELENVAYIPFKDKKKMSSSLFYLCEIDHRNSSGGYLRSKEDIRSEFIKSWNHYSHSIENSEQITEDNLIHLIKEKFPAFIPHWRAYLRRFGLDQGIMIQMSPLIDYVVEVVKQQDENEIKSIFDYIEFLMCDGDEYVQTAIATGFLEGLLNKDPDEIQFIKFRQYLGKETLAHCRAWDIFTGVMTKGLHDD